MTHDPSLLRLVVCVFARQQCFSGACTAAVRAPAQGPAQREVYFWNFKVERVLMVALCVLCVLCGRVFFQSAGTIRWGTYLLDNPTDAINQTVPRCCYQGEFFHQRNVNQTPNYLYNNKQQISLKARFPISSKLLLATPAPAWLGGDERGVRETKCKQSYDTGRACSYSYCSCAPTLLVHGRLINSLMRLVVISGGLLQG